MINILVCDTNKKWTDKFQEKVEDNMNVVAIVHSGKEAQKFIIGETKIDVVLMNVETKEYSCFEVIKFIKQNAPKTTVALIANSEQILNEYFYSKKEIKKLGIADVFVRPFPVFHVFKLIKEKFNHKIWRYLENEESESTDIGKEISEADMHFTSMKEETINEFNGMVFDLFVRIKKNHYVKICHAGDIIDKARMEKYNANSDNKKVFFRTKDRLTYINFVNELFSRQLERRKDSKKSVKILESVTKIFIEEIYTVGLPDHVVEEGILICDNIYRTLTDVNDLKELLNDFIVEDESAESHLFVTAFFTSIISLNTGWITKYTRNKLMMGAFLHDIGKLKLPKRLRCAKESNLSGEDLKLYRKHPEFGVELLGEIEGINELILQIVYQHHELNTGEGYPLGLTSRKIYPPAKIVGFASFMAEKCRELEKSPFDTVKIVIAENEEIVQYDPDVIKSFIKGFIKDV